MLRNKIAHFANYCQKMTAKVTKGSQSNGSVINYMSKL